MDSRHDTRHGYDDGRTSSHHCHLAAAYREDALEQQMQPMTHTATLGTRG